jgi:hypothetical protein
MVKPLPPDDKSWHIATKDPGTQHFYYSMVKSAIRIIGGIGLIFGALTFCGIMLIIAEVLGILEEM